MSMPTATSGKAKPNGGGKVKLHAPKRLSLGCGQSKPEGFFGIDIIPVEGVDLVHNLWEFPWPIRANSVEEFQCSHLIEHLPHDRLGWEKDGWFLFFDELYRICKPDAEGLFQHPYNKNDRAFWDPTHQRFLNETTWYYLNAEWRKMMILDHYPAEHDFQIVAVDAVGIDADFQMRNHETQAFYRQRYWNVIGDLIIRLRALK